MAAKVDAKAEGKMLERKTMQELLKHDQEDLFELIGDKGKWADLEYELRTGRPASMYSVNRSKPGDELLPALQAALDRLARLEKQKWWKIFNRKKLQEQIGVAKAEIRRIEDQRKQAVDQSARKQEQIAIQFEVKRTEAIQRGKETVQRLGPAIHKAICEDWKACDRVKQYEDQTALAMALGDSLAVAVTAAPIATLAALVVKIGVKRFCGCSE